MKKQESHPNEMDGVLVLIELLLFSKETSTPLLQK
jgi:hypothetical protein